MQKNILFAIAFFLMACQSDKSPEQLAMDAAQQYYSTLLQGDFQAFVDGRAHADSLPNSFREQLITSSKQFIRQQQNTHQGIKDFTATRAKMDTTLQTMQVFLMINYADSTSEEIVVPMVDDNGTWKMR